MIIRENGGVFQPNPDVPADFDGPADDFVAFQLDAVRGPICPWEVLVHETGLR